ncbi:MAG: type III pantothenate kinase [Bacteroidota bacterium]
MLLVIDIGNTNIVFGLNDADRWISDWRIQTDVNKTADEYEVIFRSLLSSEDTGSGRIESVVLSSVVPTLVQPFIDMLSKFLKLTPVLLGPELYDKLPIRVLNPYQIGSDLVANSLAAFDKYGEYVTVIDFGTALTFTTVGSGGRVLGVAIAPGLNTAVNALAGKTAQLPRVHLIPPPSVLGQNTVHAIQSGIVLGYSGLVDSIIGRIEKELKRPVTVVATGGLSNIMAPIIPVIDHVEPLLTLEGLKLVKRYSETQL